MSKRGWLFYHMLDFIFIACSCQRINDLGMIILCLKGHNSHKFMRSQFLVLSHSSISVKLWKKFPGQSGLRHHLTLLHVLTGIKLLNISRTSGPRCMLPLELDVCRVRVLIAGIRSSKGTWEGMVLKKQKLFPWRQEERKFICQYLHFQKQKPLVRSCFFGSLCEHMLEASVWSDLPVGF